MKRGTERVVLVAGIGTSPAVLTETVWALAHQKKPVVPEEVVVITTKTGKARLCAEMFGEKGAWSAMVAALKREKVALGGKLMFGDTSIRVMPDEGRNELDDLRTGEDNLRAADFILGELRKYTESPDTKVLASIAGGRKTMSALLFSCMSLLGREQDKVYHVLIPPEYECGMDPPFYFPQKGATHQQIFRGKPTGKKVPSSKIAIELFEVPFVRMRGWYQEKFKTTPPTYRTLIEKMQTIAPPAVAYSEIEIDAWNKGVTVGGKNVDLSATCFAALIALANGVYGRDLHMRLMEAASGPRGGACEWLAELREGSRFKNSDMKEDVSKVMSDLRTNLTGGGFTDVESLVPKRGRAVTFPLARIKWVNRKKAADVCGCLFPGSAK